MMMMTPNATSDMPTSPSPTSSSGDLSGKKVRKPYTITKSRESWTDQEHDKFLEALQLFDRDWKKIEDFVGSKTVIQIRSHAQKYFLKVQKNGTIAHVPPPRPKRKASHPYPQKASKNVPLPISIPYSTAMNTLGAGFALWDDGSLLINSSTSDIMESLDEFTILPAEEGLLMAFNVTDSADIGSKGVQKLSNNGLSGGLGISSGTLPSSEIAKQGKQAPVIHGIPDFAEVYSFIGSVFDPDTKGHEQKLKEMDPINFETVLLLMRNLTLNLSNPDFEPLRKALASHDINTKVVGVAAKNQANDLVC